VPSTLLPANPFDDRLLPFHVKPSTDSTGRSRLLPPGQGEWLLMLLIFAIGCGLRFAWPERMAVEHFDEAVYASNVWFGPDDSFRYPEQHFYAPPLLPTLIEWIFTLAGPSNLGAMLPSLVAGSLMIPLVWWVGRSWFGPVAGLAAATLCALSDAHIAFSRSALTDVLLCFWVLLAVYLTWRALITKRLWPTLGAGLFTGLAWWTKYNGWLPIAIGVAGMVSWLIQRRLVQREAASLGELIRPVTRLVAIAAIAFAVWSPWLWSLQSRGGYAAVAANHRNFVVGISGWWNSAIEQALKLREVSGTATASAMLLALVVSLVTARVTLRFTWNDFGRALAGRPIAVLLVGLALAGGTMILGPAPFFLVAGIFGLAGAFVQNWRSGDAGGDALAFWLLAAWFAGMTVSTPIYTPYPRLLLPWQVATWLAVGVLVQWIVLAIVEATQEVVQPANTARPLVPGPNPPVSVRMLAASATASPATRGTLAGVVAGAVGLIAIVEWIAIPLGIPGWKDRTAIERAAERIATLAVEHAGSTGGPDSPLVIYTISEPALLFQLRMQGLEHVRPVSSLRLAHPDAPRPVIPTFVAIGKQAMSMPGFQEEQWEPAHVRLGRVASETVSLSPLVRLDDADWGQAADGQAELELLELE